MIYCYFQGWFGSVKMKSVIGFKQVVELLHQHGAPEQVRIGNFAEHIQMRTLKLQVKTKQTNQNRMTATVSGIHIV